MERALKRILSSFASFQRTDDPGLREYRGIQRHLAASGVVVVVMFLISHAMPEPGTADPMFAPLLAKAASALSVVTIGALLWWAWSWVRLWRLRRG